MARSVSFRLCWMTASELSSRPSLERSPVERYSSSAAIDEVRASEKLAAWYCTAAMRLSADTSVFTAPHE